MRQAGVLGWTWVWVSEEQWERGWKSRITEVSEVRLGLISLPEGRNEEHHEENRGGELGCGKDSRE